MNYLYQLPSHLKGGVGVGYIQNSLSRYPDIPRSIPTASASKGSRPSLDASDMDYMSLKGTSLSNRGCLVRSAMHPRISSEYTPSTLRGRPSLNVSDIDNHPMVD